MQFNCEAGSTAFLSNYQYVEEGGPFGGEHQDETGIPKKPIPAM